MITPFFIFAWQLTDQAIARLYGYNPGMSLRYRIFNLALMRPQARYAPPGPAEAGFKITVNAITLYNVPLMPVFHCYFFERLRFLAARAFLRLRREAAFCFLVDISKSSWRGYRQKEKGGAVIPANPALIQLF